MPGSTETIRCIPNSSYVAKITMARWLPNPCLASCLNGRMGYVTPAKLMYLKVPIAHPFSLGADLPTRKSIGNGVESCNCICWCIGEPDGSDITRETEKLWEPLYGVLHNAMLPTATRRPDVLGDPFQCHWGSEPSVPDND